MKNGPQDTPVPGEFVAPPTVTRTSSYPPSARMVSEIPMPDPKTFERIPEEGRRKIRRVAGNICLATQNIHQSPSVLERVTGIHNRKPEWLDKIDARYVERFKKRQGK